MPDHPSVHTSTWFSKFFECVFLYIAAGETFFILLWSFLHNYSTGRNEVYYIRIFLYLGSFFIILSLAYSIWWQRNENKKNFNSDIKHAWLRGVIRYFLAYDISIYGFGKILKTQFATIYARNDLPVGNLSGLNLTWNYFGYSHPFAVILGLLQIGGAILLLFRRTTLLGVCVLLPVMISIVFINVFYNIGTGPFGNSIVITTGLLYLLLLRWQDLKALFFNHTISLPKVKIGFLKPLLRLLIIAIAYGGIYYFVSTRQPTAFAGKWKVVELKRNGIVVKDDNWQINPASWCNVYIEEWGKVELSPNPYIFDAERSARADYSYDPTKHNLRLKFNPDNAHTTADTVDVAISNYDGQNMEWNTIIGRDTLQLKLSKIEQMKR